MRTLPLSLMLYSALVTVVFAGDESMHHTTGLSIDMPRVEDPPRSGHVQLIAEKRLAAFRKLLPQVADAELRSVLQDERTMWYDEHVMPPAYQDSMPPFVGILETSRSGGVAPDELFSNGKFRFPFGATGGLHRVTNLEKINFLSLPRPEGRHLPIVWWQSGHEYKWLFPRGTVIGEVLFQRGPGGGLVPFEVRLRRREVDYWDADAFRPFPTAGSLAEAVRTARPDWQDSAELTKLVAHLADSKLQRRKLTGRYGTFLARGGIDMLPPIEAKLVVELLTTTPFQSCEGAVWKSQGKVECYAPTADQFSIVPPRYDAGLIAVHSVSCHRCHQHAGRPIGHFVAQQRLYGQIWGSDETFSWHPFEPSKLQFSPNGLPHGPLRREFVAEGVIEKYDPEKHPAGRYQLLN